jgi:hypothetical protein
MGDRPTAEVKKIWDRAPHQAFTDLIHHEGRWLCVFREGEKHVSPDGAIRVLASDDGDSWRSIARLESADADLRDPKIVVAPDDRLMIVAGAALHVPSKATHQSMVFFSEDGMNWGEPTLIGDPGVWMWRVVWRSGFVWKSGVAYGVGYGVGADHFVRLYSSSDGLRWETLAPRMFDRGFPNEAALLFNEDDSALCLLRRDGDDASAQLGASLPPYREWTWRDLGVKIGGPQMIRLPDGRIIAGVRLYDNGDVRTSLAWLDPAEARLTEALRLPSSGDSSYPGMVWRDGRLWVSYYSSHEEGKTCIYLAKVKL